MEEQVLPKKRGRPAKQVNSEVPKGEPCNGKDGCPLCTNVPNQPNELSEIKEQVGKLTDLVTALGERVLNTTKPTPEPPTSPVRVSKPSPATSDLSGVVPKAWRQIVDMELGNDFGIEVTDSSAGNMLIKVIVPDHLDRRVGEKEGKDHSMGLIRRASDLSDVEHWCEKIRSNIQKTYNDFHK